MWFDNMARVRPAGTLTRLMLAALNQRIEELGTSNGEDWFFTKETLQQVADELPYGSHVDDCISWTHQTGRMVRAEQPKGMEGFFEEFAAAGCAKNAAEAQLRYGQWCTHLFHWLMNRRQPVDLGWAELDVFPARLNWREGIAWKIIRRINTQRVFGRSVSWRDTLKRVAKWLEEPDMLGYNRGQVRRGHPDDETLIWTLNVRHKMAWWRGLHDTETARKGQRKRLTYFHDAKRYLRAKKEAMLLAVVEYVAQARRPAMRFLGGTDYGDGELARPTQGQVDRIQKSRRHTRSVDLRNGQKVTPQTLRFPWAKVRALRDLQQEDENVRQPAGDVGEPDHGTV